MCDTATLNAHIIVNIRLQNIEIIYKSLKMMEQFAEKLKWGTNFFFRTDVERFTLLPSIYYKRHTLNFI